MQIDKQLFVTNDFTAPQRGIEPLKLIEFLTAKVKPGLVDIFVTRHPPDASFFGNRLGAYPLDNPFQYAQILTIPRPQKFSRSAIGE